MAKETPAAAAADAAQWDEVPTSSRFVKWEAAGQYVQGELLSIEESKTYPGKGFIARLQSQEEDELVAFSCPIVLERAIREQRLIGKTVRITYTGDDGDVKLFRVQTRKQRAD